ncbi:MAG: protein kinase domain-containing protein [Candidatus Woesearchaeota archaeon]
MDNLESTINGSKLDWLPSIRAYDIVSYIGRGAWTDVVLAKRKTDGSYWALKFYNPTDIAKRQFEERQLTIDDIWIKECLGGNGKIHQNLAQNHVEEADDGTRYLAERYIDRFLSQYLAEKKEFNLEEIVRIGKDIASGLDVLHSKVGRAHGDLNPDNIGYTLDNVAVLSDFGASSIGFRNTPNSGNVYTRAPERWGSFAEITKESDVWAFGSLLYKFFTGKYIFEDEINSFDNPQQFMQYLREDKKRWNKAIDDKLRKVKDEIPWHFRRFLKKCLYDSSNRIEDGTKLITEFDKAVKNNYNCQLENVVVKYGSIAALLFVTVFWGMFETGKISTKLAEQKKLEEYSDRMRIIQFAEGFSPHFNNHFDSVKRAELHHWKELMREEGIDDPKVAYVLFLDPRLGVRALKETGARDYQGMLDYLYDNHFYIAERISFIDKGGADNFTRIIATEQRDVVRQKWEEANRAYESFLRNRPSPSTGSVYGNAAKDARLRSEQRRLPTNL